MGKAILIAENVLKELSVTDSDIKQDTYLAAIEMTSSSQITEDQLKELLINKIISAVNVHDEESLMPIIDIHYECIDGINNAIFMEELADAINSELKNRYAGNAISIRNANIIKKYYGICGENKHYLVDIADEYGLSKHDIHLIIKKFIMFMGYNASIRSFASEYYCANDEFYISIRKPFGRKVFMNTIQISKYCGDFKYWRWANDRTHMSGHLYRNSPFESDDGCGNCNGAKCDYCREIIEHGHFECSIVCTDLEKMLKLEGVDDDSISHLVYDDSATCYNGYKIEWPTEETMERDKPGFYNSLMNPDESLINDINELLENMKNRFTYNDTRSIAVETLSKKYDFKEEYVELIFDKMYGYHFGLSEEKTNK
jgi:hypothetical protein